jgi:O-antigen ligase
MRLRNFQNGAETCSRICAIALGISIPISVALDNVLLGMILLSWAAAGRYRERLGAAFQNPVALAAFVLFCLFAAGLIYSAAEPVQALRMLGKYLDLAFVAIFVSLFSDERTRHQALLALAFALTLTLILSCLTLAGLTGNNFLAIGTRDNPVVFKQYLTQSVMMAFGTFLFAQLSRTARTVAQRNGWLALSVLAAANVAFMIQGRTGQLILLALLFYLAYSIRRKAGALAAVAGILAVTAALVLGAGEIGGRFAQAFSEWKDWTPEQAAQTSVGMRMEFYRKSLELVRVHPLVGSGTGSFSKVYADSVAGTAMAPSANPHNEYLNIAIQLGAVGLATLLYLFYCGFRDASMLPTDLERHLARGLLIAFVIGCLFNSLLMDHSEGLLFAWLTGVLYAGLKPPPARTAPAA